MNVYANNASESQTHANIVLDTSNRKEDGSIIGIFNVDSKKKKNTKSQIE